MAHTVFVPTTINVRDPLPTDQLHAAIEETKRVLNAPEPPNANGGWFSQDHGLVSEPVYPVTGEGATDAQVEAHARSLAKRLGQEAIMVSYGDRARFFAADPSGDYPEATRKVTLHLPNVWGGTLDDAKRQLSEWFGGFTHYFGKDHLVAHATEEALAQHGPKVFALAHRLGGKVL